MKTSPKFVLYLTCFFLGKMVQMHHFILSHQDSGFISADVGYNLTLQCFYEERNDKMYWYKQTPGQKPRIISVTYKSTKRDALLNEFKDNQRFTVETIGVVSHLKISDLQLSDSATYYCLKGPLSVLEFTEGVTVSVKGSGSNIQALVHQSESIQPGGSVTLSCTVHTGTCDGEHSVYWFKSSEDPQPGLIYTHGDRNDQCEKKPDNQTHTCVYNLSMERLNRSHAGTYYCAVTACGHIVFGDGTKLEFDEKADDQANLIIEILMGGLIIVLIIVIIALVLKFWKLHTAHKEAQDPQDSKNVGSDDLNYAGLSFLPRAERSRRPAREREPEPNVVYATTKHSRNHRK